MKTIYNTFRFGAVALAMASALSMSAENKLYANDLKISSYEPYYLEVAMDNDEDVCALNFEITLPYQLEFVTVDGECPYVLSDRFTDQKAKFSTETGRFGANSMKFNNFKGNEGVLVSFPIRAKEGTLDGQELEITLSGIELIQNAPEGIVTLDAPSETTSTVIMNPGAYTLTAAPEVNAVAGRTFQVSLGLNNSTPVISSEFHVVLPEGLTFVEDSVSLTDRCNAGTEPDVNIKDNVAIVILYDGDLNNSPVIPEAGEGEFITFEIQAADDYAVETAEIVITDIVLSVGNNFSSVDVDPVTITVNDNTAETLRQEKNEAAYREVQEQIQTLTEALAAAEAEIDENYDGYMDEAEHEAIATSINALYAEAQAAYDAVEEEGVFDYTLDEDAVAAIKDAIDLLVENAKKAQEVSEASYLAHEADMEQYTEAYSEFIAALGEIEENWPDYDPTEMEEKITGLFTALFNDLNAAYEAALEKGEAYAFEGLDERIAEINAEIAEMKAAAEATGVAGIEAEGNGAVCYGIDGRVIANPAAGQMVIIVRDGKATKHIVK